MNDELEVLEFQFPSVFPSGTYVKVTRVLNIAGRPQIKSTVVGKTGLVHSHKTSHGQRWHRVNMDDGNSYNLVVWELAVA